MIVANYPNYDITELGDVVSFRVSPAGRVIRGSLDSDGYRRVNLCNDLGRKQLSVHRMVMAAFVGPSELQVNHINGVKADNRLENLEYVTNQENIRHSIEVLGNSNAGVRHWNCKLNQQQVDDIRVEWAAGELQRSIAKRYNVCQKTVSNICRRETHK